MVTFRYRGQKTREISFPLGGIGSGCIGLAGNGRLLDWEIFNRPSKGSTNGFSSIAVKVEDENGVLGAKFLQGDLQPPYIGVYRAGMNYSGYGFGPDRTTLAGMPHFADCEFEGTYPFASLQFKDKDFPVKVSLNAFNPLIPSNDKDSSLPAAFFEVCVQNTLDRTVTFTAAFNLSNPTVKPEKEDENNVNKAYNRFCRLGDFSAIMTGSHIDEKDPRAGHLCVTTDCEDISFQEHWYRGGWFDNLNVFWNDFVLAGRFKNRCYEQENYGDVSTLAGHITLAPGEKKKIRFVLAWYYPTCENYWNPQKDSGCGCTSGCCGGDTKPQTWKNYYATLFDSALSVAAYGLSDWNRLERDSRLFCKAILSSSMPKVAIEAVLANISILKTPTCKRLEDGSFYGFEGTGCDCGCCEGSCTHVWNYAYALPFLFSSLERSMRDLDFQYNLSETGGMNFRLPLPLGRPDGGFRACVDGQFGGVIKTWRDWKISGDDAWLRSHWEAIKANIAFAWSPQNPDKWDPEQSGVITGRQHHTLDMELYGPNSWLTGFYLAALSAGADMAEYLGESDTAVQYRAIFERGKAWVDANLFDGEYFRQQVNLKDKSILEQYLPSDENILNAYWNSEAEEIKYQLADGCAIDQVLAQWHCNLIGLGRIFDPDKTKSALDSIYRYNFKKEMRNFANPCRLYTLNGEAGTVICSYPKGRPIVPITYNDETMYGFEYQAAIHMISEGMLAQGMELITAIRSRFDGEKRNPWNEFECGNNYARSMASYALLNVFSGFTFDMTKKYIGFNPIEAQKSKTAQRFFFAIEGGFGVVEIKENRAVLRLLGGQIALRSVRLPVDKVTSVQHKGSIGFRSDASDGGLITFDREVVLQAGEQLAVTDKITGNK